MRKAVQLGAAIVLGMAFSVGGSSRAEATCSADGACRDYMEGASRKLGRGLANVVTSPFELLRQSSLVSRESGGMAGGSIGVVRGVIAGVLRCAAGAFETVTFFAPIPRDFKPVLQPEFVYANGDWAP